jgi:hypothetical protein
MEDKDDVILRDDDEVESEDEDADAGIRMAVEG